MSWATFMDLVRAEAGEALADRIEARARELAGLRVTIPAPGHRAPPTDREIDRALRQAGHNVGKAAALLAVAPSTIYRHLNAKIRPKPAPPPRLIR